MHCLRFVESLLFSLVKKLWCSCCSSLLAPNLDSPWLRAGFISFSSDGRQTWQPTSHHWMRYALQYFAFFFFLSLVSCGVSVAKTSEFIKSFSSNVSKRFFSGNWFSWFDKHEMQRDEISSQPTDTTVSDKTYTLHTPLGNRALTLPY